MTKDEETPDMHIIKTATCKTLSGKSTLNFQIGCLPDSTVHLRITKNSGSGNFSTEWIAYDDIQKALEKRLKGQAITSYLLAPAIKGKSVNTPSFVLAALKHLKLVRPLKDKQREHEPADPRPFLDQVSKLMSSAKAPTKKTATKKAAVRKTAGSTTKKTAGKTVSKKAAIKKRSVSRKKKTV